MFFVLVYMRQLLGWGNHVPWHLNTHVMCLGDGLLGHGGSNAPVM